MGDLSDESGRKMMDMLARLFGDRDLRNFIGDMTANTFRSARAGLRAAGLDDPDLEHTEKVIADHNRANPDDPWCDAAWLIGGRWAGDLEDAGGAGLRWVEGKELRERFLAELKGHFGEDFPCRFVGAHLLVPLEMKKPVCQWAQLNGWGDLLRSPGHLGVGEKDVSWVVVKLADEKASAELVGALVDAGLSDVARRELDPTQVVVGVAKPQIPALVECLQKAGVGRDAVANLDARAMAKLPELSERDPGGAPGKAPESYCEAVAEAEETKETARAATEQKAEKEAAELAEEWKASPATEKQAAAVRRAAKENGVPDEEVERALTNKFEANQFLDKWLGKLPDVDFSKFVDAQGARPVEFGAEAPDEVYAVDVAAVEAEEASGEREVARDAAQEQELDPPDDVYAADIAAQQPDSAVPRPAQQDRERQVGTKEISTGDRIVQATTYDRENPVGSDGQDVLERNDSEDDMSHMRDEDKELEERIASMTDEELDELLRRTRPMRYQEQDARDASAADQHIGREEVSIPDPQR